MELNSGPSESCNARLSIASNFCFNETESRKLPTALTEGNLTYILLSFFRSVLSHCYRYTYSSCNTFRNKIGYK